MGFLSVNIDNASTVSVGESYFGEIISGVKLERNDKYFTIVTLFTLPVGISKNKFSIVLYYFKAIRSHYAKLITPKSTTLKPSTPKR